jgi:hypothetical protein
VIALLATVSSSGQRFGGNTNTAAACPTFRGSRRRGTGHLAKEVRIELRKDSRNLSKGAREEGAEKKLLCIF